MNIPLTAADPAVQTRLFEVQKCVVINDKFVAAQGDSESKSSEIFFFKSSITSITPSVSGLNKFKEFLHVSQASPLGVLKLLSNVELCKRVNIKKNQSKHQSCNSDLKGNLV